MKSKLLIFIFILFESFQANGIKVSLPNKIDFFSNSYHEIEELDEIEVGLGDKQVITAISSFSGPASIVVTYMKDGKVVAKKKLSLWFY